MGTWFMGLNVWTLFLALGSATVNTSFPSALGRVEVTALTQLFWTSVFSKCLTCTVIRHKLHRIHFTGKSRQSLIPPGWHEKVTHATLFSTETKPNCIIKSLDCFYFNLHHNVSKCPLHTKKKKNHPENSSGQRQWKAPQTKWNEALPLCLDSINVFTSPWHLSSSRRPLSGDNALLHWHYLLNNTKNWHGKP